MTTDQLLSAIRRLADRYGLPDVLRLKSRVEYFHVYWWVLGPTLGEPPVLVTNYIGLPIALAHWEAEAEQKDGLIIWPDGDRPAVYVSTTCPYTPGDTLSRITARLLALDDGVTAIGGNDD